MMMDDHDQPMSFLESYPETNCITTCKALAYDRLSLHFAPLAKAMEPGWGLASSQVDMCKNLCHSCHLKCACVVAGAAEILSPSSGKAFQTHLERFHEGRQTKPLCKMQKPLDSKLSHSICLLALPPTAAQAPATAAMSSCERPDMTFRMACAC